MQNSIASREVIDLRGASGSHYRFRRLQRSTDLPVSGGNFVCVKGKGAGLSIVCAGTASDLTHVRQTCDTALKDHGAEAIFFRLNVSGTVREAENADIVTQYAPTWQAT